MMRKVLLFSPLTLFLALGIFFYLQLGKDTQYMPSALTGKQVPSFQLKSLETGDSITNSDLPQSGYIINFWGTWCPECHIEHPLLVALAQKGFVFIGVDYKDDKHLAERWLLEKGNPYALVLMDELGRFGLDMGVTGAPETFVVNDEGRIVYRHQGAITLDNWPVIEGYLQ